MSRRAASALRRTAKDAREALRIPFVRNVMKFQAGTVVTIVTGLGSSVIYARFLGVEQFGLFAVVSAFAGLMTIVAAWGQDTTLTTFLAEAVGRRDKGDIGLVLRYFLQSTVFATLIYTLLIIIAPTLATVSQSNAAIGQLARLALFNTMLQPFPVLLFLTLQIGNRVGLVTILENTRAILQLVIATVLLFFGMGVTGVLLAPVIISLTYVPLCLWLYETQAKRLHFPSLIQVARGIGGGGTGTYFRQGLWIAIDRHVARNLYPNLFFVVLNATTSLQVVGLFRLGLRLASLPAELVLPSVTRLSAVSLPRLAGQDRKMLKGSCFRLIKGTLGLMIAAVLGAVIFVPPLLPVVYGAEFAGAVSIFLVLLPFNLISALNIASVPLARIFRRVGTLVTINVTGMMLALGWFWLLRNFVPVPIALALGALYYHTHSLLLYVYIWRSMRRGMANPLTALRS